MNIFIFFVKIKISSFFKILINFIGFSISFKFISDNKLLLKSKISHLLILLSK